MKPGKAKFKNTVLSGALAGFIFANPVHAELTLKGYGFLLPNVVATSSEVESFSQPNSSAYTAALNPVLRKSTKDSTFSWQVAQSRVGLKLSDGAGVDGMIEFDFIDFTKASPTTAAIPRVRRAFVKWQSESGWTYQLGQDWDLVSSTVPYTYNFVGHYFQTGDIGFMRMQFMGLKKHGDWESGWALGMPAQNPTSGASGVELGEWPTLAFRQIYAGISDQKFGASALLASIRPSTADPLRIFGGAFTFFGEGKMGEAKWIGKVYIGQNTSNLGMLGLAFADVNHPRIREAGAFFSLKHPITEETRVFGGAGAAFVLNSADMSSSYKYIGGTATSSASTTGPGMEKNFTVRAGVDHDIKKGLVGFAEVAYLNTTHHLLNSDSSIDPNRNAWVVNSGVMLAF